ncbi:MAG: SAF domain-containing protein [Micrococcales bacterium]|nr:SAF domain-containing protein [Micrococcales bacterium]
MPKRLRRKPANWVLLLVGSAVVVAGLALATLVKPLPSYLVASSDIGTGTSIAAADTETVELNLGDLAGEYATPDSKATDLVVSGAIGKGELIPIRLLGSGLLPSQTVVKFTLAYCPLPPSGLAVLFRCGKWLKTRRGINLSALFRLQRCCRWNMARVFLLMRRLMLNSF